jgi:hypothetical protein
MMICRLKNLSSLLLLTAWGLWAVCAHAATYTVPALAGASIQSTINTAYEAGSNNTVYLPPGQYNVAGGITVPCNNGLTITGPVATPSTAILNATFTGAMLNLSACTGVTITYLQFQNTQALYVAANNNSGIVFWHNQITKFQAQYAIELDGSLANSLSGGVLNTVTGADIEYNTIGNGSAGNNDGSCTAAIASTDDLGAASYCGGIEVSGGTYQNLTIAHNYLTHVSEGMHLNQLRSTFVQGATQSVCSNCVIEYNYVYNFHRISYEIQMGSMGANQVLFEHNVSQDPLNVYYGTLTMSLPCCAGTVYDSAAPWPTVPALVFNDNVQVTSNTTGGFPPYGVESWGTGALFENSLIEGQLISNGFLTGFAGDMAPSNTQATIYVQNNYICGARMLTQAGSCQTDSWSNSTVVDECINGVINSPHTDTGNTKSSSCVAQTSVAPSISPGSGSYTSPPTVTLTDSGQNTSIYYTTDGSTPVPGSGTTQRYTAPFQITLNATIKVVGMWGDGLLQPLTYPTNYGYVPSAVVSASYTTNGNGSSALGDTTSNTSGTTAANWFNDVSAVTGANAAGYTVTKGTVCIAPGAVTNGANTDIGINTALTTTTESTTALCHATYSNTSSSSPGCVTVPLAGCGTLAPSKAYWIWTITNDPLSSSPLYFSNCGGSCNGSAPVVGTGTYGGFYLHGTYGTYAGMSSAFTGGPGTGQPSVSVTVTPAVTFGNTTDNTAGTTYQNYFNDVYAVTGSDAAGYAVNTGTVCIAPGTVTQGAKTDIGINAAPTATTEGATALCHGTYTNTSATSPGCVTVPLAGCGTLSPNTPYWIWAITNDPASPSPLYSSNCGGSCNGSVPTVGTGTYGGFYLHGTYGTYTGMSSAFTGGPDSPGQPSVSLSLTPQ